MKSSFKRSSKTWHWVTICILVVAVFGLVSRGRSHAQSGITYSITDLGTLGGTQSRAYGINYAGNIVGDSSVASGSNHPFYRKVPTTTDITPDAISNGIAYSVNTSGSVVGYGEASGVQRPFFWRDDNGDGVSQSNEFRDFLGAGASGVAYDINDSNRVVGVLNDDSGGTVGAGIAFTWDFPNGPVQTLPATALLTPTRAVSINNSGDIAGWAAVSGSTHAFVLRSGIYIDLGTLDPGDPARSSFASRISADNQVVGYSQTLSNNATVPMHGFFWSEAGGMKDLGVLSGYPNSYAYDINASGQIVGEAQVITPSEQERAVIWHDDDCDGQFSSTEMKDLNNLISPDPSWVLQQATGINDAGQIVGFGLHSGQLHAFLLTPSSAPPSPCAIPTPSPTPTPATTTLISVQGTGTYGGTATLSATLYSNDMPVSGKTISFTLNSTSVCGGSTGVACPTTNGSGIATLSGVSLAGINAGNYPGAVGASFAGDSSYASASQSGLLAVTPVLLLETGTNNAAAVDSVTFVRAPFSVTDNFNFSGDHVTRIIIFTSPLANPEPTLKVFASGHELPVESFGTVTGVPGLNASYIVVKLDPILTGSGPINYDLTVSLRGVTSNTATLTIIP